MITKKDVQQGLKKSKKLFKEFRKMDEEIDRIIR